METLSLWHAVLLGAIAAASLFTGAWLVQRRTGNAGIVDVCWAASLGLLALLYLPFAPGWAPRVWLAAAIAIIWSVRLTVHIVQRYAQEPEDGRYRQLREEKGAAVQGWLLGFFWMQAAAAVLLSLAFAAAMSNPHPGVSVLDVLAVLVFVVSVGGETLADRQLAAWRADPANRGRTCRRGLWRYSRHPNYFFEWLHWLVYPLLALGTGWGWLAFAAPAAMLLAIVKVTGIPPTEAQALRSRGDDYRAYQRTTSAFVPWPPRPDTAGGGQ